MRPRIDGAFLRSRIARRVFTLFVACALVPIVALSVLCFFSVSRQLRQNSQARLYHSTKQIGMGLIEQFMLAEEQIATWAAAPDAFRGFPQDAESRRLASLSLAPPLGPAQVVTGDPLPPAILERARESGCERPALFVDRSARATRLFLATRRSTGSTLAIGELATERLWLTMRGYLPTTADLVVLDHRREVLFSTMEQPEPLRTGIEPNSPSRLFAWFGPDRERNLAFQWPLFLQTAYCAEGWTVVLTEPHQGVFAAATEFNKLLPLVVLLSLAVVVLVSVVQIRRSLNPIERLKDATVRVREGQFDARVDVTSRDEFGELALSFNAMAGQLGRQFRMLGTTAEVDRAVLSALDEDKIIETILKRVPDILGASHAAVAILERGGQACCEVYALDGNRAGVHRCEAGALNEALAGSFDADPVVLPAGALPAPLARALPAAAPAVVVPVRVQGRTVAVIAGARVAPEPPRADELEDARRVAEQVAVALTNARLIATLARVNWETLEALALAVDAKSPWTAGHSHRVTRLALLVAKALRMPPREIETLHRAGLLHDIGKIGVPPHVLDKPGRLTDQEFCAMREHVTIGARILEPLSAFRDVVPAARHHHERYDGRGYPDRLAGEQIPLLARVLAVADVYDALASDRPYRPAWERRRVLAYLRENSGTQFDPVVVEAFLGVIAELAEEREPAQASAPAELSAAR
ncbi:MAG: HD domain-containing protein [Acidobacteria bacterium]|nr:HD domain-containing protein [Acidobacteriota bacterium]